jgi:dTDP-4-amino-4,6-dideoxygalactose transaminase
MSERREIPFGRPWFSHRETEAVQQVLAGHILTHGPEGKAFEKAFGDFLGPAAHCVSVSSCMAALHLAYLHFKIGPGDEVIVPAQTHAATAHAVAWVGATPVFVDCEPGTGNITASAIEAALTPRTRAISVVHFAGISCDMQPIVRLADSKGLRVIEDCAIALGARRSRTHVGLLGDAGCFSFYPVKHITTGEGGMFVTRHADVAEAVGKLRAFGVDRTHVERTIPGIYDVPTLGLNYRMSEMQAALGRAQMSRIDENLARRRTNFTHLRSGLSAISGLRVLDGTEDNGTINSHYCLVAMLDAERAKRRADIVAKLNEAGVGTSVYYPQPVPRMTYYASRFGYDASRFPHASAISDRTIALPVGPHLEPADMDYIASQLKRVCEGTGI